MHLFSQPLLFDQMACVAWQNHPVNETAILARLHQRTAHANFPYRQPARGHCLQIGK
jgi:hypothetical protein